ncbi:hypothetical protein BCR33DRAFT_796241 [Rhizoclosmatium globosum]|uniref:DinB-like domain-containing protein n=1 Tax=Rhizoclosmatium globosum TaxID=329046 RepID=A0A1Y2APK9_9FUNG|nr:hypothetical protein BCR33DRAFT_796241 [Rhizoclosmatium globosum]|eukprot:ORY23885.1 hypothetical protein BCR33DRAFT_796241 [Rhizoclosmatium globosum]
MVMGDTVWYDVLRGKDASPFDVYWERPDEELYSNAESTSSLWETWCPDRDELKERIRKQSVLWSEYVNGLEGFDHPTEKRLGLVLFHVVNHGWHHRGQIYAALRVIGK